MSEYQYYEFQAIDHPLTERDVRKLRSLSTRAEITPRSFVNTYEWGDFKGDPDALMETCFDAFVYVANWGTRRFSMRLPGNLFDSRLLSTYGRETGIRMRTAGEFVVIDFETEVEGDQWEDSERWMAALIPLRADLLRGDHRCLYLGWLLCAQNEVIYEDEPEPPVPPGLGRLSAPLAAFIDFFDIQPDLVEVAAERSAGAVKPSRDELAAWVSGIPEAEKSDLLAEAALHENPYFGAELRRRFEQHQRQSRPAAPPDDGRRTAGELLAAVEARAAERKRMEAEHRVAERARRAEEEAAARARHLDSLAGREQDLWKQVNELVQGKRAADYSRAITLLSDLRDLAARRGHEALFKSEVESLRQAHASKPAFLRRLAGAKL